MLCVKCAVAMVLLMKLESKLARMRFAISPRSQSMSVSFCLLHTYEMENCASISSSVASLSSASVYLALGRFTGSAGCSWRGEERDAYKSAKHDDEMVKWLLHCCEMLNALHDVEWMREYTMCGFAGIGSVWIRAESPP